MDAKPDSLKRAWEFLGGKHQLLIGGKWVESRSGKTFEVLNPADGKVIARVAEGCREDVNLAVEAARKAFENSAWRRMTAAQRADLIWRLGDAIEANAEEMAIIETLDNGAPLQATRSITIATSVEKLRYYAGWATKLTGSTMEVMQEGEFHAFTLREPVGVVGLIVPWNAPLLSAAGKIAPALAAGCTVVLKPAEQTPMSALRLGQLALEVGFPEGVINIVTGFGTTAGAAIADHEGVDKVSFTGSTEVGKAIVRAATGNLKRVTLELGGKSPVFVFPDADMDKTIAASAIGVFSNAGQVCVAGTRLFAHERVFDEVVEGIAEKARKLKVGAGMDLGTTMGPLISARQLGRVTGYLEAGAKAGARAYVGGNKLDREGYFVQPTVLTGTTADMSVRREEIFGPVLCAMSFSDSDIDRLAAEANDTPYGLGARIFTRDLSTAHKLARRIKAGTIRVNGGSSDINVPFGGYKQSGWGRECGREGVEIFTEVKSVVMKL